ncbi:MAG: universal stress protein [Planctomycetota bacterium]|jgi:nucleotide-binding universal stress UspA family protein|nr:universal stress protein [Planctomycetota bacterium]MDP6761253.1 universal stress protein [Planctomycetota bacterium]MDP6988362.1 universal stress protein [Planctomycetota bacterium]
MKIQHILLTSDLSPESMRPFEPIEELARELGARVTVLNVVPDLQLTVHGSPFAPGIPSPDLEREVKHARLVLDDQRAALGEKVDATCEVITAPNAARAICTFAAEHDVDLIAISTHGHSGLRRFALGSVAEQVLRHATIPVLSFQRADD